MLHILNGDASANILEQTNIEGEIFPWREALVSGPTPEEVSFDDWIAARAEHLSTSYEKPLLECKTSLLEQEQALRTFSNHDEVVLWFEHDLFCQINLLYLLNFFAQQERRRGRISLICIDSFEGIKDFKGLGQLSPPQLASLFDKRQVVTDEMLQIAEQAWAAYCSPNPTKIESLLKQTSVLLPYLKKSLYAHLKRFPSVSNGLGHVERVAMNLIECGVDEFKPLFPMFGELEPVYGFGDQQFWNHLKNLSQLKEPLLKILGVDEIDNALSSGQFLNACFAITEKGMAILNGRDELDELDFWLGGVHLQNSNNRWCWDEQKNRLIKK